MDVIIAHVTWTKLWPSGSCLRGCRVRAGVWSLCMGLCGGRDHVLPIMILITQYSPSRVITPRNSPKKATCKKLSFTFLKMYGKYRDALSDIH